MSHYGKRLPELVHVKYKDIDHMGKITAEALKRAQSMVSTYVTDVEKHSIGASPSLYSPPRG